MTRPHRCVLNRPIGNDTTEKGKAPVPARALSTSERNPMLTWRVRSMQAFYSEGSGRNSTNRSLRPSGKRTDRKRTKASNAKRGGRASSKMAPAKSRACIPGVREVSEREIPTSERTMPGGSSETSLIRTSGPAASSGLSTVTAHSTVCCVFHFLKIANPSADDIIFLRSVRDFGFETAIWLTTRFRWKCQRLRRVLNAIVSAHGISGLKEARQEGRH